MCVQAVAYSKRGGDLHPHHSSQGGAFIQHGEGQETGKRPSSSGKEPNPGDLQLEVCQVMFQAI